MSAIHAETAIAAGYALFLIAAAFGLERLARHSHDRSERYRTAGFTYHGHLDAWECPEGQHLRLHEHDRERRVARYRAKAHVCNACPRKPECTDSDDGREVVRALDPWPHSEAGRYHRGICLVLAALAALIVCVELVRHHGGAEVAVLALVLAITVLAASRLAAAFTASPANFPG